MHWVYLIPMLKCIKQAPVTLTAEWPSGAKVTKEILPVYRNNGFGEYECRVLLPRPSLARGSTLDYSVGLEIDRQNLQRDIADQTERIANRAAQNARQATLDEMSSNQMQQQADQIDLMNEKSREENQRNAQKYQELFRYSKPKTYIVTPDVFQVPGSSGRSYRIREQ